MADKAQYDSTGRPPQMPGNPLVGEGDVPHMPGNPVRSGLGSKPGLLGGHPSAEERQRTTETAQLVAQMTGLQVGSEAPKVHPVTMPGNPRHRRTPSQGEMPHHAYDSHAASGGGLGDPISRGFAGHKLREEEPRPPFKRSPHLQPVHPRPPTAHHSRERSGSGTDKDGMPGNPKPRSIGQRIGDSRAMPGNPTGDLPK